MTQKRNGRIITKLMNERENKLLTDIGVLASQLKDLRDLAYMQCKQAVDDVLNQKISDEKTIEILFDRVLDFGDDDRFVDLMKILGRHIYYNYPQLVGDYVSLFRTLFEGKE